LNCWPAKAALAALLKRAMAAASARAEYALQRRRHRGAAHPAELHAGQLLQRLHSVQRRIPAHGQVRLRAQIGPVEHCHLRQVVIAFAGHQQDVDGAVFQALDGAPGAPVMMGATTKPPTRKGPAAAGGGSNAARNRSFRKDIA
jgi:hypothetical protein